MPKVAKSKIVNKVVKTSIKNKVELETIPIIAVEVGDEGVNIVIEKQTFFTEDEDEEWFDNKKKEGDTEDDSIDVYMLDDDKSW
jgi:hypothetical protein